MEKAHSTVDEAILGIERLRAVLRKKSAPQIRSKEELSLIKATGLAW